MTQNASMGKLQKLDYETTAIDSLKKRKNSNSRIILKDNEQPIHHRQASEINEAANTLNKVRPNYDYMQTSSGNDLNKQGTN